MTKTHTTRKALLMSVLSLMLCFSMLIGTTFAWFTDTVTSAGNIIKTGKLDVELHWADGAKAVPTAEADWADASTGAIFDYDNWEPGYVQVRHIRIANKGTLAFKYKVSIIANGEVSDLAKVIDVYYVDPAIQVTDRADLNSVPKLGTLDQVLAKLGETGNGTLEKGDSDVITIAFKMQETAGNEYQEKSIGSDFSVQLLATQLAFEGDSFDNKYDVEATYLNKDADGAWLINNMDELFYFSNDVNSGNAYSGETVKLTADIDLAGYNWIPIGAGDVNGQWIGFNGIFDGQGHTISNMKITKGGGWNGLFGLVGRGTSTFTESISNVNLKNVVIENANRMTGGVVGQMYGNIENCHVEGITITAVPNWAGSAYDNGDKVGGIVGWLGDNGNYHYIKGCSATNVTLKAYRDVGGIAGYIGSSTIVENCAVDTVNITVDQITNHYGNKDANAGGVVGRIYSTPVTIQNNTEANVTITVPKMVSTAAELAAAIANGGEVVLINDIVMNNSVNLSNADFVLDGNGHTITMADGATNTHALFDITGGKATIKNVTFDGIKDGAIVRTVGVEFNANNVTAVNGNHTQVQGIFRLLGKSTIENCTFKNNVCNMVISLNYDGANNDPQIVKNCVFEKNTCNATAVVYYVKGASATIDGNKFVENNVTVTGGSNAATLYMGFQENTTITNNVFENNTVNGGTSKRIAGAIMIGYEAVITGNSFVGNKVTGVNAKANDVAAAAYYTDIDLSGNYWGGSAPVENDDYYNEYPSNHSVIINDYLTTYGD
ncbi:MAG: hypothetical protein E7619_06235 [Ruminococcaceae bacterium]|nr:hypothetical protein [Oscillospiraceae bacterium]